MGDQPARWPTWVVLALLGTFWGAVIVGGRANPGYSQTDDYVSSLAGFGARAGWIGILGIASFGLADLVGSRAVRHVSGGAGWAMVVAGFSGLAIALARTHCLGGAAGCRQVGADDSNWTDLVHGLAVTVYAGAFAVAVALVAARQWRCGRRVWAAVAVAAVTVSLLCLGAALGESDPGAWQRGWLALNSLLLIAITSLGTRTPATLAPPE